MITLPNRPDGGYVKVDSDAVAMAFKDQYATLGRPLRGHSPRTAGGHSY
jgi:hypothetical protein